MGIYDTVRPRMKSGDIIALSHYKWASWYDLQVQIVRLGTQSEYCHVGVLWVVANRVFVIESVTPYVRITPLSSLLKDGFYWIPTETPATEAEIEWMLARVNVGRYSKWQAVMAQLKRLEIGADELYQCAEFTIVARRQSMVQLGNIATPSAVVKEAQASGAATYFVQQ